MWQWYKDRQRDQWNRRAQEEPHTHVDESSRERMSFSINDARTTEVSKCTENNNSNKKNGDAYLTPYAKLTQTGSQT